MDIRDNNTTQVSRQVDGSTARSHGRDHSALLRQRRIVRRIAFTLAALIAVVCAVAMGLRWIRESNQAAELTILRKLAPHEIVGTHDILGRIRMIRFIDNHPHAPRRFGDEDLKSVVGVLNELPSLERLELDRTHITNRSFRTLTELASIRQLTLSQNRGLTGQDIELLAELPHLSFVDVFATNVSREAALRLRRLRPDIEILIEGQPLP